MHVESIEELLKKKEELHEDLIPYLDSDSCSFPVLRHPLIYDVPYYPAYNALTNKRYEEKVKLSKQLMQDKKYSSYIFIHERPHRIQAFMDVQKNLNDSEYWELLCDIWVDSENIWQNIKSWKKLLNQRKETRLMFMSDEDKAVFDSLPETITVYRGYRRNKDGLSYTLDKEKAIWFSKRFHKEGRVLEITIPKSKVFAYTNSRDEKEIIIIK